MDPRYVYRVFRSQSGLLARKTELPSARVNTAGVTTIEITRSCAQLPGPFVRVRRFLESLMDYAGV